jgi:UDPglucose 6-dehydrogenase
MRDATAITVINELTARGANIKAYDPKAMIEAKDFYLKGNSSVEYKDSKYSVLNGCNALILLTEWLVEDFVFCSPMQPKEGVS